MASGTKLVLPMVVLNMGGEMVNILHQRLNAQEVGNDKQAAVLHDVIRTMYAPQFIEALFKPQDMYSDKATKEIFRKLAHSSIMRLNESSMEKLFDLITMGFKLQIVSCAQPQQLLQVTLNHLEGIKQMVAPVETSSLIDAVIETTIAAYRHLDTFGWLQLRQRLLEVFQDQHVKISLFLQYRVQLSNGKLVLDQRGKLPVGAEVPGLIRYLGSADEEANTVSLPMASADDVSGVLTRYMDFESPMGTNFYAPSPHSALDPGAVGIVTPAIEAAARIVGEAATWKSSVTRPKPSASDRRESKGEGMSAATAGLNLLASLLGAPESGKSGRGDDAGEGGAKGRGGRDSFKINLFPDNPVDEAQAKDGDEVKTITIDLASSHTGCAKMLRELDLSDDVDEDDIGSSKGTDRRRNRNAAADDGSGGARGSKGGDEGGSGGGGTDADDMDDLLDLMDFAESK